MKKIILILLTAFLFITRPVFASDLTVVCYSTNTCTVTPGGQAALFFESDVLPGQSFTRAITATNNTPDDCSLVLDTKNENDPNSLASTFFTVIKNEGTDIYGIRDGANKASSNKNLNNVFAAGGISLGTITQSGTKIYNWTVTMNPLAGNEYQGKETKFDFDMNFSCGSPSNSSNPSNNDCTNSAPNAPTNFSAILGVNPGEVILSWSAPPAPYDYFLVAYSDNSSWSPKWGNPNVGNVTSYTVSGLGSGAYWFWVRAGNGCKPGSFTGPITLGSISGIAGAEIATGFSEGVLGEATPAAEIKEEIKGESAIVCTTCIWWPLLILQAFLILLKRKKLIWIVLVSGFIFLLFLFLNRNCQITGICRYFWLFDLGVLLIGWILGKIKFDENR